MGMMGAASKGIIKREQQHNATVYKTYYQANPFANVDEKEDIEAYQKEVEDRKLQEQDGTEIVEVTTSVIAGPPDVDASSPAGGEEEDDVVVVTTDGDARINGESELVSPTDASDEHVTIVSSPENNSPTGEA